MLHIVNAKLDFDTAPTNTFEGLAMHQSLYPVTPTWAKLGQLSKAEYELQYQDSINNTDSFWKKQAERIVWRKPFSKVQNSNFEKPVRIEWYSNGQLNINDSCVDRHADQNPNRVAYHWVPEDPTQTTVPITYMQLKKEVCRLSAALKNMGVKKGDRVTLYLPMIPEAIYSMLACARIGAVHSVIFAGFSANAISDRIEDGQSDWVITADEGIRGGKAIPLKKNIDDALLKSPRVKAVLVVKRTGADVPWMAGRDVWYHDAVKGQSETTPAETMDSEDPLFILYTSGSTGKPKGVLHTTGGYLVYAALTHETVFAHAPGKVYWCAADIGWVTGHSYIVYGPLANGATSVMYEGLPTYPDFSRLWKIVDDLQVNILYTAPTLIRALMKEGEAPVKKHARRSLEILGSVGEPINPEAWSWYFNTIGNGQAPIVDTWWQTETGGILITPVPGVHDLKPGSALKPFLGSEACILSDKGQELGPGQTGHLCLKRSWPGQMRTVYRDHQRFEETYFSQFNGYYYTGDECHIDKDGDYWIIGRADDVINVSGHRLGTAEVESALITHASVAESAVVGFPHDIKGQGIYAFVTLKTGVTPSEQLKKELIEQVKAEIGALAKPDHIQWAPGLPKTRSGKIMRRILKKIAAKDTKDLGDTTTLADPGVVAALIAGRNPD